MKRPSATILVVGLSNYGLPVDPVASASFDKLRAEEVVLRGPMDILKSGETS